MKIIGSIMLKYRPWFLMAGVNPAIYIEFKLFKSI